MFINLPKRLILWFSFFFSLLFQEGAAQRVFVNDLGRIYEIDWSTTPFTSKEITGFCTSATYKDVFSICLYKDTLYYNTNSGSGEIYAFHVDNPSACRIVGTLNYPGSFGGTRLNSMTVDKDGIIYGALYESGSIIRFNPKTRQVTNLGNMPVWPGGDLIFYRDKLYMVTIGLGIFEVNLNEVSSSTVYIPPEEFDAFVFGLIAVPKNCDENSIYAISGSGEFIELDFVTRKATGQKFKLPLSIFDAASGVEDGNTQGVFISKVDIKAPCTASETTADIRIIASTADTGRLTYALNGGTTQNSNFFEKVPMGNHIFRITNKRGCFVDTVIQVTKGITSFANIQLTGPLNCNTLNGSIVVEAISSYSPVRYSIANGNYGASGIFNGLNAGAYTLRAIDNGGCIIDSTVHIAFNERPDFYQNTILTPTVCLSKSGKIEIIIKGPADAITTQLNQQPASNKLIYDGLQAGVYNLSIIKENTCKIDTTITIVALTDPKPEIKLTALHQVCAALNGSVAIEVAGSETPYQVNFNNLGFSSNRSFSSLAPGNFPIIISNKNECRWDTSATIVAYGLQSVTIRSDSVHPECGNLRGGRIDFAITGAQSPYLIRSSTAENFTGAGVLSNLQEGLYRFVVTNKDGCLTDSFTVSLSVSDIENCSGLYVPNAFTPNNDGLNDVFKPKYGVRDTEIKFSIFNRFGELVFSTNDLAAGWDGTFRGEKQPSGAYIWRVSLVDVLGKPQSYKGTVNIIR